MKTEQEILERFNEVVKFNTHCLKYDGEMPLYQVANTLAWVLDIKKDIEIEEVDDIDWL